MEVNSSISNLMREWLTEGSDRSAGKCKKAKSFANTFQPRPERWVAKHSVYGMCYLTGSAYRLGLGATPHVTPPQSCTMNKVRRNINKRIRSSLVHREGTEMLANGSCMAWQHNDKDTNADEGSRTLAFGSHVSRKTTISGETSKIHKKRKRRGKHNATQGNPAHSLATTTAEEDVSCVTDSYKAKDLCTPKAKVWSILLIRS